MDNSQIALVLDEMADLLELQNENTFRVRSYRNAAHTIRGLSRSVEELISEGEALTSLPNIGDNMAHKMKEMVTTGTVEQLESLRDTFPTSLRELLNVPGLGPKRIMAIHEALGITTLNELKHACKNHALRTLDGMGAKTEDNILDGLATLKIHAGRMSYTAAAAHLDLIAAFLDDVDQISMWETAGSFRRGKETIGDLDILLKTRDKEAVAETLTQYDSVTRILGKGTEKITVALKESVRVDFRLFDEACFGSALLYFTGSKQHNVALRKLARENDWKLSEYGLFSGETRLAGRTEKSVYSRLGLKWIAPELREDRGEIDAAAQDTLPNLVTYKDLRGDLHIHTHATDGKNTIRELATAARDRGYEYIAITDHSQSLRVAAGLNEDALKRQVETIRDANEALNDIRIFAGVEVDILADGALDLNTDMLKQLDWVVASVHYHRDQDEDQMTKRLIAAIESGVVHCLGHPLGRIIGKRKPIAFNADRVFTACAKNNVALEINAQPHRMDLPDTWCINAKRAGLHFSIATDAHSINDLSHIRLGVNIARRGWLEKGDVLNSFTEKKLRRWMKR